jgi:hypothetical protein
VRVPASVATVLLLTTAACGNASDGYECPAIVSYAEPVLSVVEVSGVDGETVDEVRLVRAELDGDPVLGILRDEVLHGHEWTPGMSTSSNDLQVGLSVGPRGRLTCALPCGFGTRPGSFALTVEAADGSRGTVDGRATYHGGGSGCGESLDDGTEVTIRLEPVSSATGPASRRRHRTSPPRR